MQASVAYSGEDALHQVRAAAHAGHPFRIVVIDSELPDMTGEALGRALAAEADLPPANLVMMAAVGRPGDGRRFELAGFHAYLVKPCSADSLRHVLFQLSRPASAKSLITRHTALDEEQHLAPLPEPAPAASGPALRVLIAEDNVVNQKVTARLLERLGYRVDIAADGNEALEMWSRLPYDIVLMDCQMPNVDGFEATAEIRRREGGSRHTPIIALTANALQGDRERCLEAGMDDYLSKPVNAASLRRILASWASRSL
jgi:CheY-like chemotaxis protein